MKADKPQFKRNIILQHKKARIIVDMDKDIHDLIKAEAYEEGLTIRGKMLDLCCIWLREKGRITFDPKAFKRALRVPHNGTRQKGEYAFEKKEGEE
jgi:hypothetical protein